MEQGQFNAAANRLKAHLPTPNTIRFIGRTSAFQLSVIRIPDGLYFTVANTDPESTALVSYGPQQAEQVTIPASGQWPKVSYNDKHQTAKINGKTAR